MVVAQLVLGFVLAVVLFVVLVFFVAVVPRSIGKGPEGLQACLFSSLGGSVALAVAVAEYEPACGLLGTHAVSRIAITSAPLRSLSR